MPTSITNQDIVWSRRGDPIRVESKEKETGNVVLDNNFSKIQENAKFGIKNGLLPDARESYKTILFDSVDKDKKQEIRNLFQKIKSGCY